MRELEIPLRFGTETIYDHMMTFEKGNNPFMSFNLTTDAERTSFQSYSTAISICNTSLGYRHIRRGTDNLHAFLHDLASNTSHGLGKRYRSAEEERGSDKTRRLNPELSKIHDTEIETLQGISWGSSHSWKCFADPIKAEDESTRGSSVSFVASEKYENKGWEAPAINDDKPNNRKNKLATSPTSFEYFIGDPGVAALYVTSEVLASYQLEAQAPYWASKRIHRKKTIDLDDVKAALSQGGISAQSLDIFLRDQSTKPFYQSLRALALIQDIYEALPSATINTEVVLRPLHTAKWLKDHFGVGRNLFAKSLSRQQTFACITMLETGTLDLPVSNFQNVFAISSEDSLYVAASLLSDPGEAILPSEVRHVIGNIGRPGISLIIPPTEPQVVQLAADSWRVINRTPYDGTTSDCFSRTSLHLRFSDWTMAIDVGGSSQGRRDVEASLVEGFIQVNDNGRWIADLDILSAFKRGCS